MTRKCIFFGTLALVATYPVLAQEPAAVDPRILACRDVDRDKDRLKCFDAAMDAIIGINPELEERREERRAAEFGLPGDNGDDDANRIVSSITEVDTDRRGITSILYLDNGQVWQTTSSGSLKRFRVGDVATVEAGNFGSFRLTIEGRRGFRAVKRLR